MAKLTKEDKFFQWASGEFLTECMPDEIVLGEPEAMREFIDAHITEALEFTDPDAIIESIEVLAQDSLRFFNIMQELENDDV